MLTLGTLTITNIINFAAILVMVYCTYEVIRLKSQIPGGIVGKRWNFLMVLIVMFSLGYLTTPFFNLIPEHILRLIVSLIFLFGAVYVVTTVKLIYRIIVELTE